MTDIVSSTKWIDPRWLFLFFKKRTDFEKNKNKKIENKQRELKIFIYLARSVQQH